MTRRFNSRTPGGVRRYNETRPRLHGKFQFTHPGRGATILSLRLTKRLEFQFTHPGRGATSQEWTIGLLLFSFNSRTPGGVRPSWRRLGYLHFSSFNSRTPGGVRLGLLRERLILEDVSIHAPREGCDNHTECWWNGVPVFQFTHPGRGATQWCRLPHVVPPVSIHAPREGCDGDAYTTRFDEDGFNSRTPGGVRLGLL